MTSSVTITPETAVRLYLQFIDDPTQLLDAAAIKQAKGAVEKAKDPIDRLRALSALERARVHRRFCIQGRLLEVRQILG